MTVKQSSVVPWEVAGEQAVKRYSVMDLGQDSLVLCLHCHQSFCSRSICTTETSSICWPLSIPTEHFSRRDSTVPAILRPSGTLASLAKQMNELLQSAVVLPLPFVRKHLSSDHHAVPNSSRVFGQVKIISTCTRFGSCRGPPANASCRERTRHLQTIAPGPLRSSKSRQDRCHAERPVLQLTNCPNEPKKSSITTQYPSALPSSTTHRLILLYHGRHRLGEGRSLGTRARTAWETEV